MTIKKNNIFFMLFAIFFVILSSALAECNLPWGLENIIAYVLLAGIGFLMMRKDKTPVKDVFPFHVGLKPVTALLIAVLVFLMLPLSNLLADLGATVGGDVLSDFDNSVDINTTPFIKTFFTTAIIPAVFEELFFRGFFYAGFKRARGACTAIIITGILFGFFHGMLQQVLYAAVLGMLLAVLREVTGSMWAGCLYHVINNGYSVVLIYLPKVITAENFKQWLPISRTAFLKAGNTTGNLIHSIAVLVLCLALAAVVLYFIIKREGRLEDAKHFFKREDDPKEKLVTPAFVIGCIAFAVITAVMFIMMKYFPEEIGAAFKIKNN